MAVLIDEPRWWWRGRRWCHLVADSSQELETFARELGLEPGWLQTKPGRPWHDHYDLPEWAREAAVARGAVELTTREMGAHIASRRRRVSPS
jgi:hypothetical protein